MQKQNITVMYQGQQFVGFALSALPLGAALQVAAQQIDQAADQARLAVIGDPLRALEYQAAEKQAEAFALAGYTGEVPPTVQAWVEASGMDAKSAADDILNEAAAWNRALYAIRAARLKAKQDVRGAVSHAAMEVIASAAIEAIKAGVQGIGNAA